MNQTNLFSLFKTHAKVFHKKFFWFTFVDVFEVSFSFYSVSTQKSPRNHRNFLKWLGRPLNLFAFFAVYKKIFNIVI